ncbi:MAG: asparaginase [Duodenibacillus sp.]|nr:asparaginase [Duodenibacillus sp.]
MIDRKVVVVATGGTIAMKYDEKSQGLVPACSGEDLAAAVPGLGEVAPLEFIQFSNIASPGMTPQNMWDLHVRIEQELERDDVAGVIVTHGTDTLEETSYFLDLLHTSEKPIVTTAAMRGAGDTSPDGPMNILCAVRTAASPQAVGMGVLVCLNETLHAPGEVMKTHSANPDTFQSPWWGPVGYVDCDRIMLRRKPLGVQRYAPAALTARVDLIKAMTGSDREYIDFAVSRGCKGIVIEGFGRGNLPPSMIPGIRDAVSRGIAVVLTTRTPGGRVLDVYGYPGSVTDARRAGIAMGGEISAAKARLKLMIVLSEHPELAADRDALERIFDI